MKRIIGIVSCVLFLFGAGCKKHANPISSAPEKTDLPVSTPVATTVPSSKPTPEIGVTASPETGDKPIDSEPLYAETKVRLDISQSIQKTSYYCSTACVQMVLQYKGINKSQEELADELHTDPVTGTEYVDIARVVNKYVFQDDDVQGSEPGYRVQTLRRYDNSMEFQRVFDQRACEDIDHDDPVFVAFNMRTLYPEFGDYNHMAILTGYRKNSEGEISGYYFIDPYYGVQDAEYAGLKYFTKEEVYRGISDNVEPAYIW